jgi:acetoin utilization protein AcuB
MNRHQVPIEKCMSSVLFVVGPKDPVADAARRMKLHAVRHMPVVDGRRLVGILSERDVRLVEGLHGVDPARVLVEHAMTPEPYVVDPLDALARVAQEMAARRIGSAVVARNGELKGLFSTIDALRVLATLLRSGDAELPAEAEPEL